VLALCSKPYPDQPIIRPFFNFSKSLSTHCPHMLLQCLVGWMHAHESLGPCNSTNTAPTHMLVKQMCLRSQRGKVEAPESSRSAQLHLEEREAEPHLPNLKLLKQPPSCTL
jgi:hypothetical protein